MVKDKLIFCCSFSQFCGLLPLQWVVYSIPLHKQLVSVVHFSRPFQGTIDPELIFCCVQYDQIPAERFNSWLKKSSDIFLKKLRSIYVPVVLIVFIEAKEVIG